ncbi:MAG: DUF2141 domain-containing protein [Pseudomonadota bacterium]
MTLVKRLKISSVLVSVSCGLSLSLAAAAEPGRVLELTIDGVSPETGILWISVCTEEELPRRNEGGCGAQAQIEAEDGASITFDDLAAGEYSATAWHDVDGNGRMGFDSRGIPLEPIGNTAGATGSFGPPTFDQMKFTLPPASSSDEPLELVIDVDILSTAGR